MFKFLSTPSGWRATGGHGLRYADRAGISIHALRVEGDEPPEPPEPTPGNFYPRPPGGGRQTGNVTGIHTHWISIHALRVEGDEDYAGNFGQAMISIHALRVEGDHDPGRFPRHDRGISIHALRVEGDPCVLNSVAVDGISIHALRVEGDRPVCFRQAACRNFYPRPPGGGRRPEWYNLISQPPTYFYPRPPGGGRLANDQYVRGIMTDFYPRPPGGGRQ